MRLSPRSDQSGRPGSRLAPSRLMMHCGYSYRSRLQCVSFTQGIPQTQTQPAHTVMDETKFKANAANLQSIRETLRHRACDETNIWTQAALERLLKGPNQAAPVFLNSERTDFFKVASHVPPEIDSAAKILLVVFGRVDDVTNTCIPFSYADAKNRCVGKGGPRLLRSQTNEMKRTPTHTRSTERDGQHQ